MNKPQSRWSSEAMTRRVKRRYAAERRFKALGLAAVVVSLAFLAFLLVTMTVSGAGGFSQTFLTASDATDPAMVGVWGALTPDVGDPIGHTVLLQWRCGPSALDLGAAGSRVTGTRWTKTVRFPHSINPCANACKHNAVVSSAT